MKNRELIISLRKQNTELSEKVDSLKHIITNLTQELSALKQAVLEKDKTLQQYKQLSKINSPKKSEKQTSSSSTPKEKSPTPKERGNNGAKRKVHDNLEEIIEEVYPSDVDFDVNIAIELFHRDVIRYEYIPPRLIKHIYRIKRYRIHDGLYEGKAPISPFHNSNYDSSLLAHLLQQRYIYGMPVERIVKHLNEMGINIPKSTVHGFIEKTANLLDRLTPVLKNTILDDKYIHFDETYYTILGSEKGSRKGYFWSSFSHHNNLIHFFYDNGSRAKKVFTDYLPKSYEGAVQTDGYSSYKTLEGWDYPKAFRLGCVQHCKRKFLDIKEQKEANEIINLFNQFYRIRKKKPKDKWIEQSLKVFEKLEEKLRAIDKDSKFLPDHVLSKATAYCLNEIESIYNIVTNTQYDLDNNVIERPMRYISISRRNSLFCGSNAGAKRMALLYSLAISCRLNNINSYDYFNDVIKQLAKKPVMTEDQMRELLPHKWS